MIFRELTDLTNLQWSKVRRSSGTIDNKMIETYLCSSLDDPLQNLLLIPKDIMTAPEKYTVSYSITKMKTYFR